jgi:hypothetical protein
MVEHAVDQLRGAVWAMRTVPLAASEHLTSRPVSPISGSS